MHPVILIPLFALGGLIAKALFDDEETYSEMSNTHAQFLKFEKNIRLTPSKKAKLISSRKALENRIIEHFKSKGLEPPKFYIQGSYKMGTMALAKDGTYDVDLGVYFTKKPKENAITVQKWIVDAVTGHTDGGVEHRKKCVRVIYKGDYDIDLPVYYKEAQDRHPYLATKDGWQLCDPKEMCDWYKREKATKNAEQLTRIVRYFKRWASMRSKKMPSGIAFTVWVTKHYKSNERDDIAFYETAKAIHDSIYWSANCPNPVTPHDDLNSKLDSTTRGNFKDTMDTLLKSAKEALEEKDIAKAAHIWAQQLGDKYVYP